MNRQFCIEWISVNPQFCNPLDAREMRERRREGYLRAASLSATLAKLTLTLLI
jgi:hypothetical protein